MDSMSDASSLYSDESLPHQRGRKNRGRQINLYDAVAGRVTLNERVRVQGKDKLVRNTRRGLHGSKDARLAPDEVLFRRSNAPPRYAEKDIYWASDELPDGGAYILPESDLLKSIHVYACKYYEEMSLRLGSPSVIGSRLIDERSMDETALLAFGILLQEAGRDALGRRGDLALTEPAESGDLEAGTNASRSRPSSKLPRGGTVLADEGREPSQKKRHAKRRKVAKDDYVEDSGA
ncbi:hypothetical protein B0H63DRAFT_252329 [Podospora didyma]|uniref:Uncharacterized protein n=1 Tax=Podospora didyma TaxID=330526 RepID=A0AAE0KL32_9PEZI|nr:hypothetical protein B0H63DRAFT_252329 [Podospora didyma]